MDNQDIKAGDLVLYNGGLFRVETIVGAMGLIEIGDMFVPINEVRKADHRDINRITKGGPSQ